jgi:hypothetical protein
MGEINRKLDQLIEETSKLRGGSILISRAADTPQKAHDDRSSLSGVLTVITAIWTPIRC